VTSAGRKTGHGVPKIDPHAGPRHLDAVLAELADAQHGVVSLTQLREAGLSAGAVRKRALRGRLHRVHRGVYAVGRGGLDVKGRLMAAILGCGPGAVVSHRSAASLIGLATSPGSAIEVSVPCRSGRAQPGVIVHRSRTLDAADTMLVESIPCTTVARTLLDLADVQPARRLLPSIDAAERLGLYDGRAVAAVLHRAGGRPAARRLTSVLAVYEGPPATNSELESKALDLFAAAGLPRPRVNTLVETAEGPLEVDFLWPDRALVVEADGYAWHSARRPFEDDRRRDQLLHAAGYSVVRVTWRQLTDDRIRILRALGRIA
jgi:hypothetical protein